MTCRDRRGGVPPPPRQPHPHGAILHGYTARERSSLCRQCEHSHRNPAPAPRTRYPGQSPNTCPPPLRGREEATERPGGGGDPAREVFSATSRQGKGRSAPSPSAPPPRGRFSMDTSATGRRSSLCRQREHPAEILSPGAVSGAIAKHSPAPIEGAGGGRGSGRAVGVIQRHAETGEGAFRPLPVSPTPRRRFSMDTVPRGEDPLSAVNVNTLLKSSPCARPSG